MTLTLLLACGGPDDDAAEETPDSAATGSGYDVAWSTDPDPLQAGVEANFVEHVTLDGASIPDLQSNHERYVHTVFVSADLTSFTHTHMEDYQTITADDIRASTFSFPLTLPLSGAYLVAFDYAHQDQWLQTTDEVLVAGDVPQLDAPVEDFATTSIDDDVEVTLTWEIEPLAGYEADFTVYIRTTDGEDVTDLTQWLGADGHAVMVEAGLGWISHTHAWFPDMDSMRPGMTMPHLYPGPEIPFHYVFPVGGTYKMWVQFVREPDPEKIYVLPFMFTVAG